ncbi:exfoliative toxin, partial [Streptococcus pyogenes]
VFMRTACVSYSISFTLLLKYDKIG